MAAAAGLLLLPLVARLADLKALWGVDCLIYLPAWFAVCFACLGLAVLLPPLRTAAARAALSWPARLDPWRSPRATVLFAVVLAVVFGACFYGLRAATCLLGDGALLVRNLREFAEQNAWDGVNAPLCHWFIRKAYLWSHGWSPARVLRVYSTASGIVYVLAAVAAARLLADTGPRRSAILGFLLTAGYLQLFAGYAETYPAVPPAILLYLVTGLLAIRGRAPAWVPALLLGLLIGLHFQLVAFAPSFLAVLWHVRQQRRASPSALALALLAPPLAATGLLALIRFNPATFLGRTTAPVVLPVVGGMAFEHPYGILSLYHLADILNLALLVCPAALLVLPFCPARVWRAWPEGAFLALAAAFPLLFVLLFNSFIGVFRDWDLLSFFAVPLVLLSAVALARWLEDPRALAQAAWVVCGAAGLYCLGWMGLNASRPAAEARFAAVLEHGRLSGLARSYGWETLGARFRARKEFAQALNAYRKAAEADPGNARYPVSVGNMLVALGRVDQAVKQFQAAIALDPDRQEAHLNLGNAYAALGRFGDAADCYRRVVALKPGMALGYFALGRAQLDLGNNQAAIGAFEQGLAIQPDVPVVRYNLGNAYLAANRPDRALDQYRRAAVLDPTYAEPHAGAGDIHFAAGRYAEAVAEYRAFLALRPGQAYAHMNIGSALYLMGNYREALDQLQKARALDPGLAEVHQNLGNVYFALEDYAAAEKAYREALAIDSLRVEAWYGLGAACYQQGKADAGAAAFRKVLELQPGHPEAATIRRALEGVR